MESGNGASRLGLLELVHGVLFSPAVAFRAVAGAPPLKEAAFIFFLLTLGNALAGSFLLRANFAGLPGVNLIEITRVVTGLLPLFILLAILFGAAKWFLYSALFHFLAGLLGGRGNPRGTLVVCALAGLPGIFLVPVELALDILKVAAVPAAALGGLVGLGVLVWEFVLLVIGLREVHRFTTGSAVITVLLPLAGLVCLFVLLVSGIVVSASALFPSFSPG
ncbi:YIP1 family protein [Thermodesulfitimonas sp.]